MADTSKPDRRSAADVDISTPTSGPKLGWRGQVLVCTVVGLSAFLVFSFQLSIWWLLVFVVSAMGVVFVGYIAWHVIVRRGAYTWMRLAFKPSRLMEKGDRVGAEQAFTEASARANRFGPNDHPRGLMLCELAMYVKLQGRFQEALAMYEESNAILVQHQTREPLDYFAGLNNYGICFIHLKDYEAAQRILEKAVDLTFMARKNESATFVVMNLAQVQLLQFVLHLNLAFLFMEMNELTEAEAQLRDADMLAPLLPRRTMAFWQDHYAAICAMWEFESGNFVDAERELAQAVNPDYPACLRLRARRHLAQGEFAKTEEVLRKHQAAELARGSLHRPELLDVTLEFAEALIGQKKFEEAFVAFERAHKIVSDFALPADAKWRRTLSLWSQRAKELGRTDLAIELDKELQQVAAMPSRAITILDRFRRAEPDA